MKTNKKNHQKEVNRLIGSKIVLAAKTKNTDNTLIKDQRMNKAVLNHGYNTIFNNIYKDSNKSFVFCSKIVHNLFVTHLSLIVNKLIFNNTFVLFFSLYLLLASMLYISYISFSGNYNFSMSHYSLIIISCLILSLLSSLAAIVTKTISKD